MAGAGYKLFNTGDVLLASEVNTYLMQQTVMVFANATARTSALSGVLAEGMLSYLADTNATEVYDGSSWVSVSGTGDITAVTAGTGLTGGGTTGAVTLTNDMATTITASGDIVVGTGNGTYDNLPIGTTGQVLTADTTVSPYKVKWAAAAGGAWTTWTPTRTNITIGNGTETARYLESNGTIFVHYKLVWGSTTSLSGNPDFTLPVTGKSTSDNAFLTSNLRDAGVVSYFGQIEIFNAGSQFKFGAIAANTTYTENAGLSATVPFTWGTGDIMVTYFWYEKA